MRVTIAAIMPSSSDHITDDVNRHKEVPMNQELRAMFIADQAERDDHPTYDTLNIGNYVSVMQSVASA